MKHSSFLLFFLFLFLDGSTQIEKDQRLNAIVSEAASLLKIYNGDKINYDCPPKLTKASEDSLFFFLEKLIVDEDSVKLIFLDRMMQDDCMPYYTCGILDDHYREIYLKQLNSAKLSSLYQLLPIVLSGSNPGLQVDGDRAGIWQLSYLTARRFGLRIDALIDERFDVERSTEAAIYYLKFLEEHYSNRPLLVLSAFYSSVPYVSKQLKSLEKKNDENFYASLNSELKNYLLYLATWYEWKDNFKASKKSDIIRKAQKNWKSVSVKDSVNIELLAEFLGMDEGVMALMNPVWVGAFINSDTKSHPYYLPKEKATFVEAHYEGLLNFQKEKLSKEEKKLAELKERMKNDIPDPKKYKAISYKVRSGDVLGLIAQRNGVKVSSIKKWNKLSSDRINIGQVLVLYVPKNKKVNEPQEKVENKIDVANKEPKPGKGTYTTYVVKNGESLWLIARKFPGVSSENIMEWNGVSDKIKPGQKLKIYGGE